MGLDRTKFLLFICALSTTGTMMLYQLSYHGLHPGNHGNVHPRADSSAPPKIIYLWDPQAWLFSDARNKDLQEIGCPVHNCRLLDGRDYSQEEVLTKGDAVIFTIRDFFNSFPERKDINQIWVMWHREAPLHSHPVKFEWLHDMFNLTYSYMDHPDTDILDPSGVILDRPGGRRYFPPDARDMEKKTGYAAWIVSNCKQSKGQRNDYVRELSKHIPVDVYGRCGKDCPREGDSCVKMISAKYKFYLSFESMYCEQYVTEKLWRHLKDIYDIIPVTLGWANYSAFLPEKSYIDVRDYDSPRELAKYLKYLAKNDDEYLEYFKWKERHMAMVLPENGLCKLCEILHTPNYPYKSQFSFQDYWDSDRFCKEEDEEREALNLPLDKRR